MLCLIKSGASDVFHTLGNVAASLTMYIRHGILKVPAFVLSLIDVRWITILLKGLQMVCIPLPPPPSSVVVGVCSLDASLHVTFIVIILPVSWDSSVNIETGYELDILGSVPGRGTMSRLALGQPSLLSNGCWSSFPGM
jgi:hypothetical protein